MCHSMYLCVLLYVSVRFCIVYFVCCASLGVYHSLCSSMRTLLFVCMLLVVLSDNVCILISGIKIFFEIKTNIINTINHTNTISHTKKTDTQVHPQRQLQDGIGLYSQNFGWNEMLLCSTFYDFFDETMNFLSDYLNINICQCMYLYIRG